MKTKLIYREINPSAIGSQRVSEMFQLFSHYYNCVSEARFRSDICKKDFIGLFLDDAAQVRGFTTFAINPFNTGHSEYNIIYSGDTIMDRSCWGGLDMIKGWSKTVSKICSEAPGKKHYWFLISKGHKTYMYLPLFFKEYIPSPTEEQNCSLKSILDRTASRMFQDDYNPEKGLIRFKTSQGELKPFLAQDTFNKKDKRHVQFFLKKNPKFYKGDELACLAEISPENTRGTLHEYLSKSELQTRTL
jgi:hypothetical protein